MGFDRSKLLDPVTFYEGHGLTLRGRGKWRTAECQFHGGSDSMRISVEKGAFRCMNCEVNGGDTVAYLMQLHGVDFVTACRILGAWSDDGNTGATMPRAFSAADAVECLSEDLHVCSIVLSAARRAVLPTDDDWRAFLSAAGRVITIASEVRRDRRR